MGETVGLIGVGKMGLALLGRLIGAGVQVRAFDIDTAAMRAAGAAGAETAASPADAARGAVIIHLFVYDDADVIDTVLGDDGILATAAPNAILILHATILPATTLQIAAAAKARGIRVIDAPITSTPPFVAAGQSNFLVGGPDDVVAEIRPYLESLGGKVWHFGPLGTGNAAKLAKNLSNAMERVMWVEALTLAATAGADVSQMIAMLQDVSKGSAISNWQKIISIDGDKIVPRLGETIFTKDIQHAARLARELGLALALTQGAADTTARWMAERPDKSRIAAE